MIDPGKGAYREGPQGSRPWSFFLSDNQYTNKVSRVSESRPKAPSRGLVWLIYRIGPWLRGGNGEERVRGPRGRLQSGGQGSRSRKEEGMARKRGGDVQQLRSSLKSREDVPVWTEATRPWGNVTRGEERDLHP